MPRLIKGYNFKERHTNIYDEFEAIRTLKSIHGEDNIKILRLDNQFGRPYTDIYVKSLGGI